MKNRLALIVVLATTLLLVSACGSEPEPSGGSDGGGGDGTGGGDATEVVASDFTFDPGKLTLEPGAKVELTLTNEDSTTHSFTSDDLGVDIEAAGGASASTSFTAPNSGTAEFHCTFHTQMTGKITVGGGGANASGDDGAGGQTEGGQTEGGQTEGGQTEGGQTESDDDGGAY